MAAQGSDITLLTTQTPNGIKISITLEELGHVTKVSHLFQLRKEISDGSDELTSVTQKAYPTK